MVTLKNFRIWLKNRTFQALILCNAMILVLTIYFFVILPHLWINALIVISGWTSLGALALGDYLGIKAMKLEIEMSFLGEPRIKAAILHLDAVLKDFDEFASTPEFLEFIENFNKALKVMKALEDKH